MKPATASPPHVDPVQDGPRPLWSVMIPTYNCAAQAALTLEAVVCQAPGADKMEIVVVDDASSDDIADVVARHGGRVRLHGQQHNLGVPDNLTAAIRLSRGRLVHLLHGDDLVEPGFYAAMEHAFADEEAGAAYCRYAFIDQQGAQIGLGPLERQDMGRLPDALRLLASEQRIMTPSICVRRAVYERLGGFHPALKCAEDWEMWVRIARHYPVIYVPETLARYRMQDNSNTGRNVAAARDVLFNALAIDLIRDHLPSDIAGAVTARARRTYARSALAMARRCAARGDVQAAKAQLWAGLRLDHSFPSLADATRALASIGGALLRPDRAA